MNPAPIDDGPPRRVVAIALVRTMHGLISAFFLACIAVVYYAGISGRRRRVGSIAAIALVAEGVVVSANGGDCPLGNVHRQYGDDKAFFELLLPQRAAKLAVPVLGAVATLGIALLIARPRLQALLAD